MKVEQLAVDLPRYRCHKVVRAAKVLDIGPPDGATCQLALEAPTLSGPVQLSVPRVWVERHKPERGGYFVVYADGYCSYSPAEPFEQGYSRISE